MPVFLKGVVSSVLTRLDLSSNQLRDKGAFSLAHTLKHPECRLMDVDLSNNFIETKGIQELHTSLIHNRRVVRLNAAMNVGIPHEQVLKLKRVLARNRRVIEEGKVPKMFIEKIFLMRSSMNWITE